MNYVMEFLALIGALTVLRCCAGVILYVIGTDDAPPHQRPRSDG